MEIIRDLSLNEVLEGCRKRDPECQKVLFKLYYGKMLGICMRYSHSRADAEDLAQDGFIKLFDKIELFDGEGAFEGWMRRLFVNLCLDRIRRNKSSFLTYAQEIDEEKIDDHEHDTSGPEDWVEVIGREKILEEIQNLSPTYRLVFNMYVIEGYSHSEIASELNISEGTSKSNLSKAKSNLRRAFNGLLKAKHAS